MNNAQREVGEALRSWVMTNASNNLRKAMAKIATDMLIEAAEFAENRAKICADQAAKFREKKPDDPYWEKSETCASREAAHIAKYIREVILREGKTGE